MKDKCRITFTNVGPGHLSWSVDVPAPPTYGTLYKQIKKHRALGSRDIEFADNGAIYVGGMRRVGDWSITYGCSEHSPLCPANPTNHPETNIWGDARCNCRKEAR